MSHLLNLHYLSYNLGGSRRTLVKHYPDVFSLRHCKDTNFPLCTQTIYKKNALKGLFFDIYQHQKAFFFYFSLSNACFCIQKVSSFAISVTFAFQMRTTMRKSLASCHFPAIENEHSESFFPKTPIFLLFLFHIPIIYCIFAEDLQ